MLIQPEQAFAIFGIDSQSSPEQVRRVYRRLVKRWHPDQFAQQPDLRKTAETRLKLINQAYSTLKHHLKIASAATSNHGGRPAPPNAQDEPPPSGPFRPFSGSFSFCARVGPQPEGRPQKPAGQNMTGFQQVLQKATGNTVVQSGALAHETAKKRKTAARSYQPHRRQRSNQSGTDRVEAIEKIKPIGPIHPIGK